MLSVRSKGGTRTEECYRWGRLKTDRAYFQPLGLFD
jgi:hypothetical protein